MHLKCSVNGCEVKTDEVDLYNFPRTSNILQTWIDFCDRGKYWKPGKNAQICSAHFSRADVQNCPSAHGRIRQLKPLACPSIKVAPKEKLPTCAVLGCKNSAKGTNKDIHFFEFPHEIKQKAKWISFCGRNADWLPGRSYRVCSEHFQKDEIETGSMRNKTFAKLKSGVTPSLNAPKTKNLNTTPLNEPAAKKIHLETNENSGAADTSPISTYSNTDGKKESINISTSTKVKIRDKEESPNKLNKKTIKKRQICSVRKCINNSRDVETSANFYPFPKEESILKKWIEFCCRDENWKPNENSKICSKHFNLEDFGYDSTDKTLILKRDAIPLLSFSEKSVKRIEPNLLTGDQIEISLTVAPNDQRSTEKSSLERKEFDNNQQSSKHSSSNSNIRHHNPKELKLNRHKEISTSSPSETYEKKKTKNLVQNKDIAKTGRKSSTTDLKSQRESHTAMLEKQDKKTVARKTIRKSFESSSKLSRSVSEKELNKDNELVKATPQQELRRSASHSSLEFKAINKHTRYNTDQAFLNKRKSPLDMKASPTFSSQHSQNDKIVHKVNTNTPKRKEVDKISEVHSNDALIRSKREFTKSLKAREVIQKESNRKSVSNLKLENHHAMTNVKKSRSKSLDSMKGRRVSSPKLHKADENEKKNGRSTYSVDASENYTTVSLNDSSDVLTDRSVEDLFDVLSETISADRDSSDECDDRKSIKNLSSRHEGDTQRYADIMLINRSKDVLRSSPISYEISTDPTLNKQQTKSSASEWQNSVEHLKENPVNSLHSSKRLDNNHQSVSRKERPANLKKSRSSPLDTKEHSESSLLLDKPKKISKVIEVSLHNKKIKKRIKVTLNNKNGSSLISAANNASTDSNLGLNNEDSEPEINSRNSPLKNMLDSERSDSVPLCKEIKLEELEPAKDSSNTDLQLDDTGKFNRHGNYSFDKPNGNLSLDHINSRPAPCSKKQESLEMPHISSQNNNSLLTITQDESELSSSNNTNRKKIRPSSDRQADETIISARNLEQSCHPSKRKSLENINEKSIDSYDNSRKSLPHKSHKSPAGSKRSMNCGQFKQDSEKEHNVQPPTKRKVGFKRFKRLDSKDDDVDLSTTNLDQTKALTKQNSVAEDRSSVQTKINMSRSSDTNSEDMAMHDKVIEVRFPFGSKPGRKIRVTLSSKHELSNVSREISPKRTEPINKSEVVTPENDEHISQETKVECNALEIKIENHAKRLKMSPGNNQEPEIIDLSQDIKEEEGVGDEELSVANMNSAAEKSRFDIHITYPNSIDQSVPLIKTSPFKQDEDSLDSGQSPRKHLAQLQDFENSTATEPSKQSKSPISMLVICQELQICEVTGCRNNSAKPLSNVTFHPFPLNIQQRNKWVEFCRDGDDWKPQDFSRVCSKHFQSDDYVYVKLNNKTKKVLKIDAIPSIRSHTNNATNTVSPFMIDLVEDNHLKNKETIEETEKESKSDESHPDLQASLPVKIQDAKLNEQLFIDSMEDLSPVELGIYSPHGNEKDISIKNRSPLPKEGEPQKVTIEEDNESFTESDAGNESSNEEVDDLDPPSPQSENSDDSTDEKYKLRSEVSQQKKVISSLYESQSELRRKIRKQSDLLRTMQKRNVQMEQTKKELQRKVLNMERTLKRKSSEDVTMSKRALRTKIMLSPIGKALTENQIDLLLQIKKNVNWTTTELSTAFSLRYLSKDSYIYDYLKEFYPLPSIPAIQKYAQRVCLYGGLLKDILDIMNTVGKTMSDKDRATVLVYDSIPVQSKIQYDVDGDEIIGPYNRMHIIMARGLFSEWKQPVYIDFDRNLTADELKNVVSELYDVQFNVVAFVCDCSQPKLNLLLELGVSGKNTFFDHPSSQKKICCFFDSPRLLEMMRKALVTKGFTFLDGTEMTREPLNKLLESGPYIFPDGTLFSPENMLNPTDEEPGNYDHAMELFSLTIATLLHKSPDRESLVLAKFIETMYRWFQIMSSLYVDGNDRLVLQYKDREDQISLLNKTYDMVKSLRCIQTNRINIFQEAILISIRSLECLSKEMNEMYEDRSILGNKLSQNSLDALLNLVQSAYKNGNVPPMNAIDKLRAVIFGKSTESEVESILTLTEERYVTSLAFEQANISPVIREKPFEESLFTNSIKLDSNTVIKNIEEEGVLDPLVEFLTKKHRKQFCSSDGKLPPKLSLTKDERATKSDALSFSNYARQMKSYCIALENIFKQINKDGTLSYKTKTLTNFVDRIQEEVNVHTDIIKSYLLQRILVRLKYLNLDMENDSFGETDTEIL